MAMTSDSKIPGAAPGLIVVIPAYNEAATIAEVVRRALAVNDGVVVVDDYGHHPTEMENCSRVKGQLAFGIDNLCRCKL